jgi:tetratricopeptide (TPR) repeat protein
MLRARNGGRLLQGEADYQLHLIYLWYEHRPARAIELLHGLQQHYPGNPLFPALVADVQDAYLHDMTASLDSWRRVLALARQQRVNFPSLAEAEARLGAAKQLDALQLTDAAIDLLDGVVAKQADAPYSSLAQAYLRLGEAHDRLGSREAAVLAYKRAAAAAPPDDPYDIRNRANDLARRVPDRKRAEAYRLSLEGWRHLEDGELVAASGALERSLALAPDDPVANYRLGRVLEARKDESGALARYAITIRNARTCPPSILATAYLDTARLYERTAHRSDAIRAYRTASTLFGASAETRLAAGRALARLDP